MKRGLSITVGIAAAAALALGGAAYVYFFSGLPAAPRPLALRSPAATAPVDAPPSAGSGLAGSWTAGQGSAVRYHVRERFAGQSSSHEAVAQTSSVSGGMTVTAAGAGYHVEGATITVGLAELQSVDSVVGFNVSQRDRVVRGELAVAQYPNATFKAGPFDVPAAVDAGQTVTVQIPGTLTIHGASQTVTAAVQARRSSAGVEVAGSIPITMTDYGVQPPRLPITAVQPQVTIEFLLELGRS